MTEMELAQAVACGALPSPQPCAEFFLTALRITGTGLAFRSALDEHVFRAPENVLTPEFCARCAGLPILVGHPDGALTDEEHAARNVGAIMCAYIAGGDGVADPAGNEVWGVGRVYSEDVVRAMAKAPLSTSPAVVFKPEDGNQMMQMPDGSMLLVEGVPSTLCHVCVCPDGVWDKSAGPSGVRFDSEKEKTMTEEEQAAADKARKDADGSNIDKVLAGLTGLTEKMDAFGKRMDAMETTEKVRADKARADAETLVEHGKETRSDAQRREEEGTVYDAQMRADAACNAWGRRAAAPMQSEKPMAYRKRLLREHTRHSDIFKDADLDVLAADAKLFAVAEKKIYADSVQASRNPKDEGYQIERNVVDPDTGHRIRTWHGGDTIFKRLASPGKRVTKIHDTRSLAGR